MAMISYVVAHAPEVFIFLAIAIGTLLGRVRIHGFALGAVACTLIVAVLLGQLGEIQVPALLKSIFFSLFVFTIGYHAGPEFFASLSLRTLKQVALALVMGASGLAVVLAFAFALHLDPGTAAGLASGALTQSSMMGTASGALSQLGLAPDVLRQQQANIAVGYAVTYVAGYILTLVFVPLIAPRLMGVNLREEAEKLEAELSGGEAGKAGSLLYRRVQARAYRVSLAAGRSVGEVEARIGRRSVIERVVRGGSLLELRPETKLAAGDEIVLGGPTAAIVAAASIIGPEVEGEELMREVPGAALDVLINVRDLHGRTISEIAERYGPQARGVFLRTLTRQGREVPIAPSTRIYVGDVATLVGISADLDRLAPLVGQALRTGDRTDIAYLAGGLAIGLLFGVLSVKIGSVPLTLGGGGGALVAGLVCGWFRSRNPTIGAMPPPAQQTLIDLGLAGFVAAIGLSAGPAAWTAIQTNGPMLLFAGLAVTLTPLVVGTLFAHRVLRINPVIVTGSIAGAMTVDAAVTGACEVAGSQTPLLGVAVPYAMANVVLTVLGPIVVGVTAAA